MRKNPPIYRRVAKMTGTELLDALEKPQKEGVKMVIWTEIKIRLEST